MPHDPDPRALGLEDLSRRSAEETHRFRRGQRHDPRFGYELFRRAFVRRDERAWESIYRQYEPLVASWVRRQPAFAMLDEPVDYFVNRAFEKMWSAIPSDRFNRFADLRSLLRYLQMCAGSAVLDSARARQSLPEIEDLEDDETSRIRTEVTAGTATDHLDDEVMDRELRQALWDTVGSRLKDERERIVVECVFVQGMAPRHIQRRFPELFATANAVSRVKENVLERLKRDAQLAALLSGGRAAEPMVAGSQEG
jgi:RNA polymerase sigma factor (sigma-70 family)